MSKQPGYQNSGYKLFDAGFASLSQLEKGPLGQRPQEERKALYNAYQAGFDSLQDEIEDAQKNGKQVFLKEHAINLAGPDKMFTHVYSSDKVEPLRLHERGLVNSSYTNPTCLPDSILLSMRPIIQIRNPILMYPSMVRAVSKAMGTMRPRQPMLEFILTLRHSRALYDWYLEQGGNLQPQVLDADDIINDRAAVRHVCLMTGLDPDSVLYEWEEREEPDPRKAAFLSTINASKGIIPSLAAKGVDFETEKEKWKAEFGEEDGEDLAKAVLASMADYKYLLSKRTYISSKRD
ncbi:hypothetical protein G6514_008070 [Epicoccum nigrum]|nr:hypothetical protein G6514_008070 [Epicoccum nigrum]